MRNALLILTLVANLALGERIKDIATVAGVRYVHLKGVGIVMGLSGSGDSDKNTELQEKFKKTLTYWGGGNALMTSRNMALVMVTATVPTYVKPGQSFPISVSSFADAKDLTGGELLECALRGPITPVGDAESDNVTFTDYAVAQGKVVVDPKAKVKTTGVATAILEREFGVPFHSNYEYITLLLNQPDFNTASRVSFAINNSGLLGESKAPLAQAIDAGSIHVRIPAAFLRGERVVDFVSLVLGQVPISASDVDREAKVVIDRRTGTIVINGEVKVRPFTAVIDSRSITIPPRPKPGDPPPPQGPVALMDVVAEFSKANLPSTDIITILQSMDSARVLDGKLEIRE